MSLFRLFFGIAMLVMGRRLFWLFLGVVGFVFGFDFAERTIHGQADNVILIIALLAGALGGLVVIFLQKLAVLAGGFFAVGYLLIELLKTLCVGTGDHHWILFIVGGVIGAILMSVVFGWTLIILSSLIGSILILQNFHFGRHVSGLLFFCLAALGIVIQAGLLAKRSLPDG